MCSSAQNGCLNAIERKVKVTSYFNKTLILWLLVFIIFLIHVVLLFVGCNVQNPRKITSEIGDTTTVLDFCRSEDREIVMRLSYIMDTPPLNPTNRFADDPDAAKLRMTLSGEMPPDHLVHKLSTAPWSLGNVLMTMLQRT